MLKLEDNLFSITVYVMYGIIILNFCTVKYDVFQLAVFYIHLLISKLYFTVTCRMCIYYVTISMSIWFKNLVLDH